MTALYDALGVYLDGAGEQNGQKVLIMYTDGGDTRSALTMSDMIDLLRASDVTVYVVGYLSIRARRAMHSAAARRASPQMTGGLAFFPVSVKEIDKMYDKIQREIAARYSLGYMSTDDRTDGAWRGSRSG